MDEADLGKESEEFHDRLALQVHQQKRAVMINRYCEDCGEEIPEARRRAVPGCARCVRCQTEFEERN